MNTAIKTPTPAKLATLRADPAATTKAVAPSKPKIAAVVPVKGSRDIPFPGGVVRPGVDRSLG